MAIKANKLAQMLCKDDHEGVKDLETQFCKYTTTHPMAHPGPPRGYVSGKLKNPVFLQWLMVKGYFFFVLLLNVSTFYLPIKILLLVLVKNNLSYPSKFKLIFLFSDFSWTTRARSKVCMCFVHLVITASKILISCSFIFSSQFKTRPRETLS